MSEKIGGPLAVAAGIAFVVAATVFLTRAALEGPRPQTVIPGVCFAVGAVFWFVGMARSRGES
ncbi:MAG: hypothetical protein JXB46_11365 [Candidatus Eisenbacteria bacterium]|nr:hypothetical protein [Candidatus Eisenbacteria bacterium]